MKQKHSEVMGQTVGSRTVLCDAQIDCPGTIQVTLLCVFPCAHRQGYTAPAFGIRHIMGVHRDQLSQTLLISASGSVARGSAE